MPHRRARLTSLRMRSTRGVLIAVIGAVGATASGAVAKKHHHAPSGPSVATLHRLECAKTQCSATHKVLTLKVLKRRVPRRGSGVSRQRGGDDVPRSVWIYPVLLRYDEKLQVRNLVGGYPSTVPLHWVTSTQTTHWRERDYVLRHTTGAWVLRIIGASATCQPDPGRCRFLTFGGGA